MVIVRCLGSKAIGGLSFFIHAKIAIETERRRPKDCERSAKERRSRYLLRRADTMKDCCFQTRSDARKINGEIMSTCMCTKFLRLGTSSTVDADGESEFFMYGKSKLVKGVILDIIPTEIATQIEGRGRRRRRRIQQKTIACSGTGEQRA